MSKPSALAVEGGHLFGKAKACGIGRDGRLSTMSTFMLSVGSLLKMGGWDCKSLASTEGKEAPLARGERFSASL